MLSDEARSIETALAKALGVESTAIRNYAFECVEEHLWRGGTTEKRRTGFKFVRETHSGSFVHDAGGTDVLPVGYEPPPEAATG
jgi:hypothetical protein